MSDRPHVRLGEVARVRSGFAFKSSEWTKSGVPVVKISNVKSGSLVMDGCSYVSQVSATRAPKEFNLSERDILIAMTGYIGDVARTKATDLPAVLNQRVGKFFNIASDRLDDDYLYSFLSWSDTKSNIAAMGYGSAQPNVSPSLIENILIPLPPIHEQRAIAHILGTLDDKIELNRRMAATLEEMARAIFKSWFIDFDPVRAKAEGRPTNLPPEIDALFPDSFEDSELGPIPQGWGFSPLSTLCTLSKRQTMPASRPHVTHDHYSLPAFDKGQMPSPELGESILSQKFVVEPGSVLMSKLNPETPRVWYVGESVGDFAICSTEFLVLLPSRPTGAAYLYCLAMSQAFRAELEGMVTGTSKSHQRAQPTAVMNINVVKPDDGLFSAFELTVKPILMRCLRLREESQVLTALRDALLPKLISGEIAATVLAGAS